ncbi:hypothetical protein TNCV_4493021 [Trichonephila clavipes]|uniref:Uncharacterized protein n=1 Tax=Trichonephila clavipes TaxID=2585209 RepID=A0A8X6VJF6_TRICX|nr:hypothetical protein TNCV_4493021 [Trichonephila clavipes]
MSGHEEQRVLREEAMQLRTENPADNAHANFSPETHCAQIKNLEKLSKINDLRIKCLQDFIEIETFDKNSTDATQLAALIKEKAANELEYATTMGELKVLFPCPIKSCTNA